jgi:hypothetical protein
VRKENLWQQGRLGQSFYLVALSIKDNTVSELTALPAPEPRKPTEVTEKDFTVEQSVEALDFQKKLSEKLKGFGLEDIRVRILDQMKTKPEVTRDGRLVDIGSTRDFSAAEGLFDQRARTIFLGLDTARAKARDESPEAIDFALSEVMDHEMVHAMRNLDLWTQKEWSLLENSARKFKVPGTNKTFYQDAVERYVTQQPASQKLTPVGAMEEAVAELVRYSKKDRKLVGGKPKNLIDRIFEFFRRLGSAMQGTGFNSMNDLISNIESGALGARERGVVRTARGIERLKMAVPERGVGLARDVREFRVVEEPDASADEISLSLKRLDGMPESFDVSGQAVEFGYFEPAVNAAKRYTERSGKVYEPLTEYAPINEDVARKIAAEFQMMDHSPDDPEVAAAYNAMIEETIDQYRDILDTGLEIQFIKGEDPYGNPRNAILDVVNNNHLWVFPTVDGFGSDADLDVSDNPLLQATEFETADGDPMLANDVFRVVHDYFGHIKNGVGFRARGEENAWQAHAAMYSPLARRAMTTETRGQNSYVNFGPNRDFNLTANGADTVYADQKVGLLPLWVSEEARLSDPRRRDGRIFQEGLQGAIRDDGKVSLTHYSRGKINRTDPSLAGGGLDRSRRYSPKGTYFGITEAVDDGYRKETGLGPVENKFSVDPVLLYPLAKDYLGLVERYPAGNMDYDATIQNLKDNGFIGFWNNSTYGKAAFIFEPLIADKAASKIIGVDSDQILESLKRVDGIIERNPAESITRIYDESATRPFLEEQETNGYPPFSWQAKTYSVGDRIVYQMADKLIGLKKAEEGINRYRALAGIPPIKNKDSAYVGEESIPGKIGIEVKDFQENVQRPYAKKIADSGIPIEELDEFLTFRHAVERNNRIQLRDPSRNVETNPGSGSLKTGERLSNFYVKQIMENRYGYEVG